MRNKLNNQKMLDDLFELLFINFFIIFSLINTKRKISTKILWLIGLYVFFLFLYFMIKSASSGYHWLSFYYKIYFIIIILALLELLKFLKSLKQNQRVLKNGREWDLLKTRISWYWLLSWKSSSSTCNENAWPGHAFPHAW